MEGSGTDNAEPEISSIDLVRQFNAGDNNALRLLYTRHEAHVLRIVASILSTNRKWIRLRHEEIANEVWREVARSLHTFVGDSSFTTWVFAIARRVCLDRAKTLRTFKERQTKNEDDRIKEDQHDRSAPVHDMAGDREVASHLTEALEKLSERQRAAFVLRARDELEWEQVAAIMGEPTKTVRNLVGQALARLRFLIRAHAPASSGSRGAA